MKLIFAMSLPRPADLIPPGGEFLVPCLLLAAVCIAAGAYFFNRRQVWLAQSAIVTGEVIDIIKKYSRDDKMGRYPLLFPKVAFQVNGMTFETVAEEAVNANVGMTIPVRYNQINPEDATIGEGPVPGVNPKVLFIAASLFVVAGVLFTI